VIVALFLASGGILTFRCQAASTQVSLDCPEGKYSGIRRCVGSISISRKSGEVLLPVGQHDGRSSDVQILVIDPKNPGVHFETVLPEGKSRDGPPAECQDVNVPDSIISGKSTGPGCYDEDTLTYPSELVRQTAERYNDMGYEAVVVFNADFFDFPGYRWGPQGLTVKNGARFDGIYNDTDMDEVDHPSLSVSKNGTVRIGYVADIEYLPDADHPDRWNPDKEAYWNSVGGLPQLVQGGVAVDIGQECLHQDCPELEPRGRTAMGVTLDGELLVVVIKDDTEAGVSLQELANIMSELGAVEAINLDGGGSSQLWYDGALLVETTRAVTESLLVYYVPYKEDALLIAGAGFRIVRAGRSEELNLDVQNTSTVTWVPERGYALVNTNEESLGAAPVQALTEEIARGQVAQWTIPITAPPQLGLRRTKWQMTRGDTRFGEVIEVLVLVVPDVEKISTDTFELIIQWLKGLWRKIRDESLQFLQDLADRFEEWLQRESERLLSELLESLSQQCCGAAIIAPGVLLLVFWTSGRRRRKRMGDRERD
jgi:hypothetical protein